jgi:hypothetical protein
MITAVEARALYDRVGIEATKLANDVSAAITKAAGSRNSLFFLIGARLHHHSSPNDIQARVMEDLRNAGFEVTFGRDGKSYVPRGLADDDGNGPSHINVGFHIKW